MKSLAIAVTLVLSTGSAAMSANWESNYGKALTATRSDDRPLLVVIESAKAQVDAELMMLEGEHAELLANYDLCRVDASTDYGKKVAEAFGATQFPHTTIIDKGGDVVLFKQRGQITAPQWTQALTSNREGHRQWTNQATNQPYTTHFRGSLDSTITGETIISETPTITNMNQTMSAGILSDLAIPSDNVTSPVVNPSYQMMNTPSTSGGSYCPSCQRNQGSF